MADAHEGTPVAICTSDWHLDDHTWTSRPELHGDSVESLRQIVNYAEKYSVPILAAGDLIDVRRPSPTTIQNLIDTLDEFEHGVYYIQGQHELQYPTPWLQSVLEGRKLAGERGDYPMDMPIHWVDHKRSKSPCAYPLCDGYCGSMPRPAVGGLDWTPRAQLPARLTQLPELSILLMHQVCRDFMGELCTSEFDLANLPSVDVVVMGDFHEHRQLTVVNSSGDEVLVLSPGSINMRTISEQPDKYVWLLRYDPRTEQWSAESLPLRTRPLCEVSPLLYEHDMESLCLQLDTLLEEAVRNSKRGRRRCADHLHVPMLSIRYSRDIERAASRLREIVGERAHLFARPLRAQDGVEVSDAEIDETVPITILSSGELDSRKALTSCLPLVVDPKIEPDVYDGVAQMLAAPDPQAALEAMREAQFKGTNNDETITPMVT